MQLIAWRHIIMIAISNKKLSNPHQGLMCTQFLINERYEDEGEGWRSEGVGTKLKFEFSEENLSHSHTKKFRGFGDCSFSLHQR